MGRMVPTDYSTPDIPPDHSAYRLPKQRPHVSNGYTNAHTYSFPIQYAYHIISHDFPHCPDCQPDSSPLSSNCPTNVVSYSQPNDFRVQAAVRFYLPQAFNQRRACEGEV